MRQKKLWHRTFNDDGKRFESFVKENVLPITRSNVSSFDLIWSDHHHAWMSILSCIHVKFYALQFYVNALYTLKSGMNEDSQRKWALPLLLNLTQIHANWQPSLWQQFMQCASQHSTRTQNTYTRSLRFGTSTSALLLLPLLLIVSLFILHTSLSRFNAHHHHFCINC